VSGDNNASGYSSSTSGVLLGLDTEVNDGWRVGAATGYTQSHLNGQSASADSDNYHLSVYGGKRFEAIALRLGGATTWH
ncbi:autotransporter outer membrane beta-barrel domain-containing protein, partial [Pseudomonas urmiensis]|uniref:autotransporter outer membrane beta-barrel domain-containing protein n=1 Tax=Pseudomonas urmiensis TaxID=2745493 RepID=UPI0034D7086C